MHACMRIQMELQQKIYIFQVELMRSNASQDPDPGNAEHGEDVPEHAPGRRMVNPVPPVMSHVVTFLCESFC